MELKELLEQLDFNKKDIAKLSDEGASVDDFRTAFQDKFVSRKLVGNDPDIVNEILGSKMGSLTTKVKRDFDLKSDEVKDKKFDEILDLVAEKTASTAEGLQAEIEKLKDTTPVDDKLKELQSQLQGTSQAKEKLENDLHEANKERESLIENHSKELQSIKTQTLFNGIKSEIKFADEVNDMTKAGFFKHIEDNFIFTLDDKDSLTVTDKNGNKIENDNRTDTLGPLDVLLKEAGENKLLKVNNAAPGGAPPPAPPKEDETPVRKLHPAAEGHSQIMKETENVSISGS